jgi:hypothetical protein
MEQVIVAGLVSPAAAAAAPPCTPAAAAAASRSSQGGKQPSPRVTFHDDTSVGILSIPSPTLAALQAEDDSTDHTRLLHSCPAVPRNLLHGGAMWAGSASGFEASAAARRDPALGRASSSNGVVAAGAVADGLTGILALVKQLQGNLAGLESDMQQLHGVLHRPAGSHVTDGSCSSSVLGHRKGSAQSELLSECDASAADSVRGGGTHMHSRSNTWAAEMPAVWKVCGGEGCSSSEPVTRVTPPLAAAAAAAAEGVAGGAAAVITNPSWVGSSSSSTGAAGVGRTAADVEAWVGSHMSVACRLQREGSITAGGAPLQLAAAAAAAAGQVASHCIGELGTDEEEEGSGVEGGGGR